MPPHCPAFSDVLDLASALIACPSVTPAEAGCMALLAQQLEPLGFVCERMDSGPVDGRVSNLWALRMGSRGAAGRTLVFAGHVDVVPPGPPDRWHSPPFVPTVRDGKLYGRGAADMKSPIAAFVVAAREHLAAQARDTALNIALLITSDEEGAAVDGTAVVCELLQQRGTRLDWCIVGEPSAVQRTGDTLKCGRRGSLSGKLSVRGVQGHIAYPHIARNPIHLAAPALAELAAVQWDAGNAHFPPTTWQLSNIHAGTGAGNVIPGELLADFNFRFGTASTPQSLQQRLEAVLRQHGLDYTLQWTLGAQPFLTAPDGVLVQTVREAVREVAGIQAALSTGGGTSDGRFIAPICPEVIEIGPPNASIHQIDEHVDVAELRCLQDIYCHVLDALAAVAQAA